MTNVLRSPEQNGLSMQDFHVQKRVANAERQKNPCRYYGNSGLESSGPDL